MKKSVSLVLGSGGARGYAHIGAIEALEKSGYRIVAISGSSMGALIGGLYASGSLDEYKKWVLGLDIVELIKLIDLSFASDGLIKGERVFEKIHQMMGDRLIEDLPIAFTAVATSLEEQNSVWFQSGSLIDAIRASIAIPTIFTPKIIDGVSYIDGGILNPLPTVPLLANRSDLMIAIDVQSSTNENFTKNKSAQSDDIKQKIINYLNEYLFETKKSLNAFKIVSKSIEMMQSKFVKYELANHQPDLIVNIPRQYADFYDFHRAKELIEFGYERMMRGLDTLNR